LDLVAQNQTDYDLYVNGLIRVISAQKEEDSGLAYLESHWEKFGKESLNHKEVIELLQEMNLKASTKFVKEKINVSNQTNDQ
jgi:hypothetical protein